MIAYADAYEATRRRALTWAGRAFDDAEDVLHDAWTALLRTAPALDSEAHAAAYLYRCVTTVRRGLARERLRQPLAPLYDADATAPEWSAPMEREIWREASAMPGWAACTDRERLALVLAAAGWPYADIAACAPALLPNVDAVKQATARARRKMLPA